MSINIHISGPKMIMHNKTIAEMFMIQLNNNKGLFGIDCSTGEQYSYTKLRKDVLAMVAVLQDKDVGFGDVVMSTDYGTYEGQTVVLSGLLIGATVTVLDYTLRKKTLATLIDEAKPDVIFCSAVSANAISDVLNDAVTHRPAVKISTTFQDGFLHYSDIVSADNSFRARPTKPIGKNRPCAIVFSSGTTGTPKAVFLTDDALKSALISFKSLMEEPIENKFIVTSPVFWYTGILLLMLSVHFGKPRLFFSAKPTVEQILGSIDKFKPTFIMTGVAAINAMMSCQMSNGHRYNIDSLTTVVVGGSPMQGELQKIVTKNLLRGRIPIKQGYGASEQGILTLWSMESDINTVKDGSVGRPAAGIKIKIVDVKTGKCVGPNTEGEIRIKSVSNMMGYGCDMKKTVNSYDEDGWFMTGDIGYFTNDGCVFIVGRIKEMLCYKCQRIAPTDIETILLSHPAVLDAGVTSKRGSDGVDGDILIGVVKIDPGRSVGPAELVSYVDDKVKDHEKLRGGVVFVNDIPRSPAGKLLRDELKTLVE